MSKPSKRETAHQERAAGDFENEDVLRVVRQFPIVMRHPLIWGMLLILVAMVPWSIAFGNAYSWVDYSYGWMLAIVLILLFYWLRTWVGWYYSIYVLTEKRIVVTTQKGFFSRSVSELALNNIQNVTYAQEGLQAAIFHFGSISIQTLSGSGGFDLKYIHHPERFARAIIKASGITTSGSTEKSD